MWPNTPRPLRGEILAMAYDVSRTKPLFDQDRERFRQFLTAQANARGLSAAIMITPDGSTVEKADIKMDQKIVLPSPSVLGQIKDDQPQIALIPEGDHVAAVIKLRNFR